MTITDTYCDGDSSQYFQENMSRVSTARFIEFQ
jgi:hypothetical protein